MFIVKSENGGRRGVLWWSIDSEWGKEIKADETNKQMTSPIRFFGLVFRVSPPPQTAELVYVRVDSTI